MSAAFDHARLADELVRDEALRLKPYRDRKGKLTIGIGRNLDDVGITREEAFHLLANDIERAVVDLDQFVPWWRRVDDVRQRVLVNMCFNMGIGELLKFRRALAALEVGNYAETARQMLESEWANEVGDRATRLAEMMRSGIAGPVPA